MSEIVASVPFSALLFVHTLSPSPLCVAKYQNYGFKADVVLR